LDRKRHGPGADIEIFNLKASLKNTANHTVNRGLPAGKSQFFLKSPGQGFNGPKGRLGQFF
jgi:hypothetical protein